VKIHSDPVQAYRDIASQFRRSTSPQTTDVSKVQQKGSSVGANAEIDGAKFLDYLSKAERQFLSEVFTANTRRSARATGGSASQTLGKLLDVKE
jgi:hypothetical protein